VNYGNLTRYNSVHQSVQYGVGKAAPINNVNNKIIQRNAHVDDTRIDQYRGRAADESAASRAEPAPSRTAPAPAPQPTGNAAFGANRGNFDAKTSSQRGQSSRASHPAPAPKSSGGGSHSAGGGGGSHGGGGGGGSHGGGGRH
jgi:uncharacterized membrane protein YgcG